MARPTTRHAIGFSLLMLSACVAPQKAAPPPAPQPVRPPPPPSPAPPPPDWRDRAPTQGDWSYRQTGAGGEAVFGTDPISPRLALRCARPSGQVWLVWPGATGTTVSVQTTETSAVRTGTLAGTELQLAFAARDPMLDQMAFSRGRFMLTAGGQALIVPSWPEIARVIEDCR